MALNALEKNKIFGTEQNPKNSVPQGGTEIIFERNTSLLEAAKKCLERQRKTDFSKQDNGYLPYGQSCSAFSGERNSEAAIQNAVPVGITDAILWGNTNETAASSSVCYKSLEEAKIPTIWQELITNTLQRKRPEKITEQKWQAIINQIYLWINKDLTQLQKIIKDGWTIQDIFGCHKRCPEQRTDHMGLLMLIQGKTIERVNMGAIRLKTSSGAGQCFYKNILNSIEDTLIYKLEGLDTTNQDSPATACGAGEFVHGAEIIMNHQEEESSHE